MIFIKKKNSVWKIKTTDITVKPSKSAVIPFCTIWLKETKRVTFKSFQTEFFPVVRLENLLKNHFLFLLICSFISLRKHFFKNLENSSKIPKLQ